MVRLQFVPYVFDRDGERVDVSIVPMGSADALRTETDPKWQTPWTSEYLASEAFEKYAVKVGEELVALGAYEVQEDALIVHIVYMEAEPGSNPTIVGESRKYRGIGRLLIAFGIKLSVDNGFGGDVVLEAKTTKLAEHYAKDFGAVKLPSLSSAAPRFIIADEAAKRIFFSYLE